MYSKIFVMKRLNLLLFLILIAFPLSAQSADKITEILESNQSATFGQVCYLSAVQQGLIDEQAEYEDAIQVLFNAQQISELKAPEETINYQQAVHIFSKLWDIKGGLMYKITKGSPRYAFKQFQTDGVISKTADPSSKITGPAVLTMYTKCIKKYGNFDISSVSME